MKVYEFLAGDGNEGNYYRGLVGLEDTQCPYAALHSLVVNRYIPGMKTRKYISKSLILDGEAEFTISAYILEGPKGESPFGSAWLTAELRLTSPEQVSNDHRFPESLKSLLDRGAWQIFKSKSKSK